MKSTDFSDEAIRANCPMCDGASATFAYLLAETPLFRVTLDANPLTEGHILIIPKLHVSCIGEYDAALLAQFREHHSRAAEFVRSNYGSVVTFEHGKFGQTVYHSHIHVLPFAGTVDEIIPEGTQHLESLEDIAVLHDRFDRDGGYLYLDIQGQQYTVDKTLAAPRFFRDRFATALGAPERGNWKQVYDQPVLRAALDAECERALAKWPQA